MPGSVAGVSYAGPYRMQRLRSGSTRLAQCPGKDFHPPLRGRRASAIIGCLP